MISFFLFKNIYTWYFTSFISINMLKSLFAISGEKYYFEGINDIFSEKISISMEQLLAEQF